MRAWILITSVVAHLGLGAAVSGIKEPTLPPPPPIRVTMRSAPPPAPEPPAPEPATPEPPTPEVAEPAPAAPSPATPRARSPQATPPAATPSPATPAVPDFGVSLTSGAGPGVAVAQGSPGGVRREEPVRHEARSLAAPPPPADTEEGCPVPASRPRPRSMPRPSYTDAARVAQIEGRVRVRITIGPDGAVRTASVVEGLGHGLDEAALEAARGATFEPAERCGEPVEATFTLAVRFTR